MGSRILIVEDDIQLCQLLRWELEQHDFEVITAHDGKAGLVTFEEGEFDIVVLDIALPVMNGLDVCSRIRKQSNVPILIMTAHAVSERDIAEGLDLGADEYMLKPLGTVEFRARINALLRRATQMNEPKKASQQNYQDTYLDVNLATRRIKVEGEEIRLTPTEFNLLALFIQNTGEVLTFSDILEQVWGAEYKNEHHYPRIYVSHLRRKIEPDYKNPTYIHNEYGIGYRFVIQTAAIN